MNTTNPQFDPSEFIDRVRLGVNKSLFARFQSLQQEFKKAVNRLTEAEPSLSGKNPKELILWTFNNSKPSPLSPTLQKEVLAANTDIMAFTNVRNRALSAGRRITENDLAKNNIDENMYLRCLKRIMSYIAWAFDIVVPQDIVDLYDKGQLPTVDRLADDLTIDALAANPEPRTLVLFVIDNSVSMTDDGSLEQLKNGMALLLEEISRDEDVTSQLELFVATAGGGARIVQDFDTFVRQFGPLVDQLKKINGQGRCKMAAAIDLALDRLQQRRAEIQEKYVDLRNCPWLIVLTNGRFADDMSATCRRLQTLLDEHQLFVYWRLMSPQADMTQLSTVPAQKNGQPQLLTDVNGFFKDINNSIRSASKSTPGGREELQNKRGYKE